MSAKQKLFQDPQPKLPAIDAALLLVLRRVKSGDPFRDKLPGLAGRQTRLEALGYLQLRGLVRQNRDKLWRITSDGIAYLKLHSAR
jgi:hypothetical protein